MFSFIDMTSAASLSDPKRMALLAIVLAVVLLVFGASGLFSSRDQRASRLRLISASFDKSQGDLRRKHEAAPSGWKKALIPEDPSERAQIRYQLAQIGFDRPDSVEIFFILRLFLALFPPVAILSLLSIAQSGAIQSDFTDSILAASNLRLFQISTIATAIGFYGPGYWLKRRLKMRRNIIRNAFPNALDLLQISMEAGLGFDAAITRVGQELGRAAPEIAYELLLLQIEIQAGRDREAALFDMAERMGIEEAKSFALVIVQSLQFGTSLTHSLKTYAIEMREMREIAAQEKANKLPVQMSGVMSVLMLPALFLITLTPIIIRYTSMY